jgi:amino acid adenylation domain-containing protein
LRGILEYATGIFEPETIRRLADHYQNLLAAVVADPQQRVSGLKLLSDAERHQLLVEWNDTAADYPRDKTIHQLFEAQAAKTPEAVAVVSERKQLTYRELNRRANQLAHRLRAFGVGPDVLVGIYVERSVEFVVGLLGILKAGGAYVPLDIKNPKPRLQQQLKDLKVLVTRTEFLPQLPVFAGSVLCLDHDRQESGRLGEANLEPLGSPENLAYVIFTSGSTGVPKGVAIRHRNLVNYTHFICRRLGLNAFPGGLKFALVSTVAADLGNTCLFPALLSGGTLQIVSEEVAVNADGFARMVSRHGIDVLKITPSHLSALLAAKNPQAVLPRHFLILGGEALTRELAGRIRDLGGTCRIINHYGPTETTVGSLTLGEQDFDLDRLPPNAIVPVGRPIANTQAYILDEHLQPVAIGLRGQLYLGGDGVAQGYYQNPKLTAEKFICNPFSLDPASRLYVTGDLARYLPDGRIEFLGRMDQQVKIRGYRIELGEIEAAIREHPGISQCVLAVQTPAQGEARLVAYVVPGGSQPLPATDGWRDFLKSKLPDYMIPTAFVSLEKLPLNANGKLDRKALPALDWASSRPAPVQRVELPRTPLELQILLIWQRILYVKTIGIRDNFFDLGGHSLMAIRLISEINQSLNRNLTIPAFFRSPTIEGMAQTLEKEEHSNPEPKVVPLQPGKPGRSIFFLDASMGQCQLAQLLDGGPASYATIVPLSAAVFRAAARNDTKNLPTVEELAAPHAALIQKQQPSGACILVGHSFGGLLAFEVAHQLQRQGRMVEMILLLDSWATTPAWWRKLQVLSLTRARRSIAFRARHWWSKTRPTPLTGSRQKTPAPEPAPVPDSVLETANQPIGGVSWEILERVYRHARKNYRLHPLDSRAIVFRAQHSEVAHYYAVAGKLGWDGLLTRGLVVVETPGDHFSLLKRPHLLTLADHVKQCLKPSP